ncbi:quorum sensing histidine kinase QseC [soil metagenome]
MVSLAFIVHVAWRETSSVFDDSLKEGARLALALGAALQGQEALAGREQLQLGEPAKLKLYYQIVAPDGRVLRRAENAPTIPFTNEFGRQKGHMNVWADGQAWRVYVLRSQDGRFQVQIGQPWDERLDLLDEMAEELAWPALILLLLLGAFCWFVIRHLLRPIENTAERIAAKSPDDLEPVPAVGEPRELLPIVQSLNLVLARLSTALQSERRFTADAAHELRTPLAALRMRIQLMQRQRAGAAPVDPELQTLRDDVDRCTTLVESLLALARLDPLQAQSLQKEEVELASLFERLDTSVAGSRGIAVRFDPRAPTAWAHPALLQSALRNLLDNAVRYSTAGGGVQIESSVVGEGGSALPRAVRIAVRDNGPGVLPADRERLTERFFRVLGTGESGSGLGLSIVSRIAALHEASLRFEDGIDGRGLGVVLEFPSAPARP